MLTPFLLRRSFFSPVVVQLARSCARYHEMPGKTDLFHQMSFFIVVCCVTLAAIVYTKWLGLAVAQCKKEKSLLSCVTLLHSPCVMVSKSVQCAPCSVCIVLASNEIYLRWSTGIGQAAGVKHQRKHVQKFPFLILKQEPYGKQHKNKHQTHTAHISRRSKPTKINNCLLNIETL